MNKSIFNKPRIAALIAAATLVGCGGSASESVTVTDISTINPSQPVDGWQLVWADEFDGQAIDAEKWTHEVNCDGGGNQELQCYTDSSDNSFVSDGTLKIVAKLNDGATGDSDDDYTSARMKTQYKGDFKYGRIEMRAKLPKGQGTWPAFWMMPTDSVYGGWPKSGEVDIMEAVNLGTARDDGSEETNIYGTIHYGAGPSSDFSGAAHTPGSNPGDSFNTYAIEWQEGEFRWYFNDTLYATQRQSELRTNSAGEVTGLRHRGWYAELYDIATGQLETDYSSAPFDQDFYLILNLAVGGTWPSSVNEGGVDPTVFADGETYEIDYVRVFQCSADPETGRGCETTAPGYNVPVEDGGLLVSGKAPSPTLAAGEPDPITIFDDETNLNWVAWDCCGGTTPALVPDDADRGNVYEFTVSEAGATDGTVFGFITRSLFLPQDPTIGASASPHNALAMAETGYVNFDVKVMSPPSDSSARWMFKIEADEGNAGAWEQPLSNFGRAPVVGEWTNYQIPLADIQAAGVDLTSLDVIMIFPEWQRGANAVFRMDNVAILNGASSGGTPDIVYDPAEFTEAFGNATVSDNTYTFPTGAEPWAGFANLNDTIYPMEFPNGGRVTFRAAIPEGGVPVDVRFVFEFNPFPDVEPNFQTDVVTVDSTDMTTYTVDFDEQGSNTFSSFLLYLNTQDAPVTITDVVVTQKGQAGAVASDVSTDPAEFTEAFGNAAISSGNIFTFPTGAEDWAGFANKLDAMYPLQFPNGGRITFTGSAPDDSAGANVRFVFEFNPFPDVDPSFQVGPVLVSGAEQTYTIEIPAQDAANTYSSFLMYLNDRDSPVSISNVVVTQYQIGDLMIMSGGSGDAEAGDSNSSSSTMAVMQPFQDSGALKNENTFTVPSSAEAWAGFANENADLYPLNFANGGTITFTAALPEGGAQADVRFRFENAPFPNVDPAFDAGIVSVSTTTPTSFTINVEARPSDENYSSLLMYIDTRDTPVIITDIIVTETPMPGEAVGNVVMQPFQDSGALKDGDTFTVPTSAEDWAGFANENAEIYPLNFANGGTITFTGAIPSGGQPADVRFRFENAPFPDVEPAFNAGSVTVSGGDETTYTISVPAQDAANNYSSLLMYVDTRDAPVIVKNIVVSATE